MQSGKPRSPEMADEHAEGTRRQHLARPHQGVPLENAEEWPSCPWVSIYAGLYGVSLAERFDEDTGTAYSGIPTHVSWLFRHSATPDRNCSQIRSFNSSRRSAAALQLLAARPVIDLISRRMRLRQPSSRSTARPRTLTRTLMRRLVSRDFPFL